MICPTCHGRGFVPSHLNARREGRYTVHFVCEDCGGSGIAHCCEGLQSQPDLEAGPGHPTNSSRPQAEDAGGPGSKV